MIYIQGEPIAPLQLAWNELEQSILVQKQRSPTPFHYASKEELHFELRVRAAIVHAALMLEHSGAAFETFANSRCNDHYWTRDMKGGFMLKPSVSPSEAIDDIYMRGYFYAFECATAIVIVLYKAVLDIIGREQFDRLFDRLYLYSWHHDADLKLITVHGKSEAFPGDVQYFKNPDVDPKSMQWQGENVIVMPGGRYFGHGIGVTDAEAIIGALNRHRLPGSTTSAFLIDEVTFLNFSSLRQMAEGAAPRNPVQTASAPCVPMWESVAVAGLGYSAAASGVQTEQALGGAGTFLSMYRIKARIGSRMHVYG